MPIDQDRLNHFLNIPFVPQDPIFEPPRRWADRLGLDDTAHFALPSVQVDRATVRAVCRNTDHEVLVGYVYAMTRFMNSSARLLMN